MTTPPTHDLETVRYHPDELATYHRNPRRGDIDAIARSLEVNGQYRPIVVNLGRKTGRPLEVLAGNHTLQAAQKLGWTQIVATTIDVTDTEAARIVAADNRTADLGDYDTDALTSLLADLDNLDGTGYTDDDLDLLTNHTGGPLSLDDLEDEYGELTDGDLLKTLTLKISGSTLTKWNNHRATTASDDEALNKLL